VRLLSFCVATFWGLGAYISGLLSTKIGMSFWLCFPLAGLGTALFAFVLGQLIVRSGWVTFLMITVVIAEVFGDAVGHINFLGGYDGIINIPHPCLGSFEFISKSSYYYLTLGLVAVCVLIFYAFYKSPIGYSWIAIGKSGELAESTGINLFRYRMAAYVVAAFTTGLSGSLYAHYTCVLVPETFGIIRSLYMSISAVVGGLHFYIAGPIVGSVVMNAFPELIRFTDRYEPIIMGFIIVLCTLFFRSGILGILPSFINYDIDEDESKGE
jgi:branched-chain amino acid transport system permease protein